MTEEKDYIIIEDNKVESIKESTISNQPLEYAGFWRRVLAYVIDIIIVGVIAIVICVLILVIGVVIFDASYVYSPLLDVIVGEYL